MTFKQLLCALPHKQRWTLSGLWVFSLSHEKGTSEEERKVTIVRHSVHFVIQGIGQVSPEGQGLLAEELGSECLTEN